MSITGLILAGGAGRRMGGADKGWVDFEGRPLIERLLPQLALQVDAVMISANRNVDRYASLGVPVVEDVRPGFAGPLAGLEAGLAACSTDWLLTCPVDTLNLPSDYAARMLARAPAVAWQGGRMQPVFMLVPRAAAMELGRFLDAGTLKVGAWAEACALNPVPFDDTPTALCNLNDWQALQQAQQ